ncbi:hypothetical protein F4808DRAFT_193518 [Astrocystis sublimbata]|nr:hypothetical protein F4808DRAFT_193518 [Astrocystis sublimbata]
MNWTEGSLARHSRGRQRNTLVARQKQHFAKARGNLLNPSIKQGPVKISFLPSESSSSELLHQVNVPQTHRRVPFSPSTSLRQETRNESPADPLRHATHAAQPTNLDRRKRLLAKSDWAGLKLQKPPEISFPGQIYATRRWTRAARPPERVPNDHRKPVTAYSPERHKRIKRSSMRIQIGSQEVRPSIATGSQSSSDRHIDIPQPAQQAPRSRHDLAHRYSHCARSSKPRRRRYMSVTSDDSTRASQSLPACPEVPIKVVQSSSSVIHEPVPLRHNDFQVLEWSPSSSPSPPDDRSSLVVEIERPTRPVPLSQESEQRRWKDWVMAGDSSSRALTVSDTAEIHTETSRSSALTLPSHLQPRLPSLHLSSEADLAPVCDSTKHIGTEELTDNGCIPRRIQKSPLRRDLLPSKRQCASPKKLDEPDDLNSEWMKFVFGQDADSEDIMADAIEEAAHQVAVELQLSDTSGSADEQTETVATCGTDISLRSQESTLATTSHEPSSESNMATKGSIDSESTSSNVATMGSTNGPSHKSTCFVMPKAFVGKRAHKENAPAAPALKAGISKGGRKGRGKRRKLAADGRPDIRSLPDFEGDPIEEIDDD